MFVALVYTVNMKVVHSFSFDVELDFRNLNLCNNCFKFKFVPEPVKVLLIRVFMKQQIYTSTL